jgi:hypothetical protein
MQYTYNDAYYIGKLMTVLLKYIKVTDTLESLEEYN